MNPSVNQTVLSDDEIREILVKRIDHEKQSVGMVIGVVEPAGRRVIGYGEAADNDARTLDGSTIFEIGSVTKVFTSLLLADMVERKEVALDDPAAKYLPATVRVPERNSKPIRLLDLAMHTSGLPRLPSNLKPKDPLNPYAAYGVDDLYEFLSGYALPREPGSEVEYSNLGAGLLGHVLARHAGMDYESLVKARITQTLGMTDTSITLSSSMQSRMATGHNAMLTPVRNWNLDALAGAGALRSSANDMLTFLEAFVGRQNSPLAAAMKLMLQVRRPVGNTKLEMGLGWSILSDTACHDGGTGGFSSFLAYDLKAGTGVVVLSNAFTPSGVVDIGLHLLDPKAHPLRRDAITIDPTLLDKYTGSYQLPDRILEITRDGERLFAGVAGGPKFEMLAEGEKKFLVKATGSRITFESSPDGRVAGVTMQRAGREPMPAPRLA